QRLRRAEDLSPSAQRQGTGGNRLDGGGVLLFLGRRRPVASSDNPDQGEPEEWPDNARSPYHGAIPGSRFGSRRGRRSGGARLAGDRQVHVADGGGEVGAGLNLLPQGIEVTVAGPQ